MADRILRAEIWESDRFLDLPSDTHRLAFIRLLSAADDFGNLQAGLARMRRTLSQGTQAQSDQQVATVLQGLMDADLIRPYRVVDRDYWHIPRMETHKRYLVRACPASPWDDASRVSGKELRRLGGQETRGAPQKNQQVSQKISEHLRNSSANVLPGDGDGDGDGDGEGKTHRSQRHQPAAPADDAREDLFGSGGSLTDSAVAPYPKAFEEFWAEYPRKAGKRDALRAWEAAVKFIGGSASPAVRMMAKARLINAARGFAEGQKGKEQRYIPHPATWLRAGRWDDDAPEAQSAGADAGEDKFKGAI